MFNLTEKQQDVLRSLVKEVRANNLPEEFWILQRLGRQVELSFDTGEMVSVDGLTPSMLDVFAHEGLILHPPGGKNDRGTFTAKAFKAVDTNFAPQVPAWNANANQVTIHGSVYGAVQVASPHAQQHVSLMQSSQVGESIKELSALLAASSLAQLDKEEAALALDRVADLAGREKSPDVLAKIREKLDAVTSICGSVAGLAATAGPHLTALWEAVSKTL